MQQIFRRVGAVAACGTERDAAPCDAAIPAAAAHRRIGGGTGIDLRSARVIVISR
jgi:hypothetical protein